MKITELNKINLDPGDVLVIKTKSRSKNSEELTGMLSEIFPNNKVILARHTDTFEIIKQKALK